MRFSAVFVALLAVSLVGCGSSENNGDASVPNDMAMPGTDSGPSAPICDVVGQTGCAAGSHCSVTTQSGTVVDDCIPNPTNAIPLGGTCMPVQLSGAALVGDLCTPGTVCTSELGIFKCRKPCFLHSQCAADEACVGPTGSSTVKTDSVGNQFPLAVCIPNDHCDPIAQDCGSGLRCLISRPDDEARVTVCGMASGQLGPGGDCQSSTDCAPGLRCNGFFCRQLCYLAGPPDGGSGGICPVGVDCAPISVINVFGECN
jgi:hypothetical protein